MSTRLGAWAFAEKVSETVEIEVARRRRVDGSQCNGSRWRVVRIVDGVRWGGAAHTTLRDARTAATRAAAMGTGQHGHGASTDGST